jgi:cysteine-rich repeat protein
MRCYGLAGSNEPPIATPPIQVIESFYDPSESRAYEIVEADRLCIPADVSGWGVEAPAWPFVCYEVSLADGEPVHNDINPLHVNSIFGPRKLRTFSEPAELCIPAMFGFGDAHFSLSLDTVPYHGGYISSSPGTGWYAAGTPVRLTASPSEDFEFVKWEGDVSGYATSLDIRVDGDLTIVAIFRLTAEAAPTTGQRRCVQTMNRDLWRTVKMVGATAQKCVRNLSRNRLSIPVEDCVLSPANRVASMWPTIQAHADGSLCASNPPPFGFTDADSVFQGGVREGLALVHDLFGFDLDRTVINNETDRPAAACQQAIQRGAIKCLDERMKGFYSCKKRRFRARLLGKAEDLVSCLDDDPWGRIAKACDPITGRIPTRDLNRSCLRQNIDLSEAFPGCERYPGSGVTDWRLLNCVDSAARCRVCRAVQAADRLEGLIDCDDYDNSFYQNCTPCGNGNLDAGEECDDGNNLNGDGCFADCTLEFQGVVGDALCELDSATSNVTFYRPPDTVKMTSPVSASLVLSCGSVDPATGKAPCSCELGDLEPIVTPYLGVACPSPHSGCQEGAIDCNGGERIDLDIIRNHDVGSCSSATPNETCRTKCVAYCQNLSGAYEHHESACEGYCQDGQNDGQTCNYDGDCPGGECASSQGVPHRNQCNCECVEVRGTQTPPGGIQCEAGITWTIESHLPCDGMDVLSARNVCIPLTTEFATSRIEKADMFTGTVISTPTRQGNRRTCEDLSVEVMSGLRLEGSFGLFDTHQGDYEVPVSLACP